MAGVFKTPTFVDDIPGRASAETEQMRTRFAQIAIQLRARPGEWAAVAEHENHVASTGLIRRLRETLKWSSEEWDIASRRIENGNYRMFIRYLGPAAEPAPPAPASRPVGREAERPSLGQPDPQAAMVLCCCEHTKRRHLEQDGFCQASGCDCEGFIAKAVEL